ncbi:type I restriction endonuclease [Vibrio cholerae]|uniref:type I restriction endonuclease subunit R n=1 Tax=Vibrio cholerae TaxID=666 RepID=UPI000E0BBB77|nr:HsdR family type I site-specific deoxyribonuclease [Vibrio cholerae]EKF9137750.1 type I restriction endonuclease subunit R [Vibrio cholerae]ELH0842725.1 type I restriction endonuclease subunit R [Vibrio cholerae]TXZ82388.1 type I restriction endonuclease subunit R [Vibrio cholerae]GIA28990.1 type I restriction endonuclease [Vibrio cholerae]HBC3562905.1 type I restriction endonuclease subunit R [Vibrio cholerae]
MSHTFTEAKLEQAIISLLGEHHTTSGQPVYPHYVGSDVPRANEAEVLILDDLRGYLNAQYKADGITSGEIETIVRQLQTLPASDLYQSNKTFCQWLSNGFLLKREDRNKKDLYIELMDTTALPQKLATMFVDGIDTIEADNNRYRLVNQLEIEGGSQNGGQQKRIPDAILYVNGLPVVVFEFKSAVREEEATTFDAWRQLCVRYRRDIPKLFVYNTLCIVSDGVTNKMGNLFAPYEFFYAWRKVTGNESTEKDGINALYTMIQGLFHPTRLLDVIKNFVYFPDTSKKEIKLCCRYPQYYAARKLYYNIKKERKEVDASGNNMGGSGKGGTYFGATGCGKSYTMQFLARLLMKSVDFESPTIVLITDRNDLDDQLSKQFCKATAYIGDDVIQPVSSRQDLRDKLAGRASGGVFLTTIHKFTEDIKLLTDRCNVVCISDEAHRSQINLDLKITIDQEKGIIKKTYGFAKYLHDSLPNATYVGFTGTPIDATLDVFGPEIDTYTMTEAVNDGITVRIVYEGRAAKVILDNSKLEEIEKYYEECERLGANEHQIDESKKASANMNAILGDPDRIAELAKDFVTHYEKRVSEGSTIKGKAMFVCASREIAYEFYKNVKVLRPLWFVERKGFEEKQAIDGVELTEKDKEELMPLPMVNMVMTRGQDDKAEMYALLKTKDYRKELDKQFKNAKSNFKIAIVVDMWLTGFDVPELDTIYIDKPLQKHNLIQTISRVNRKFEEKDKGLVVDYIGIKSRMNQALAMYSKADKSNFEDIRQSLIEVRNHLHLLAQMFHTFDSRDYFSGAPVKQLECLNQAAEFALQTKKIELRFMGLVKRLKAAYDICVGSEDITQDERERIHFYIAVRSIVFKLTKGNAPDTAQMNKRVREMIAEALRAEGVEEIFTLGDDQAETIDIFDDEYMDRINKIKLPNTKMQLLQKMLEKAISDFKKVNQLQGIDFSKRFKALVDKYNERKENDVLNGEEFDTFSQMMTDMIYDIKTEMASFEEFGIDMEEKAFLDILVHMCEKYHFTYDDHRMLELAKEMKIVVDDTAQYPDWSKRDDIKAKLKVDLILLLHRFGFPPVANDEVYKNVLEQAENFKKHSIAQR